MPSASKIRNTRVQPTPAKSLAYVVRESTRARHVRLRISVYDASLMVVVPEGFDRRRIPEVLEEKWSWIARTRKRIAQHREQAEPDSPGDLPQRIHLRALGEERRVEYHAEPLSHTLVVEKPDRTLVVRGNVGDTAACKRALCSWVSRKARAELVPWLLSASKEQRLPVSRVQVRGQQTRWGSCSLQKTISINRKLLFLPPPLVEQVFIHELCHTVRLDHSRRFWALVRKRAPRCQDLEEELRTAWRYLPAWMDGNGMQRGRANLTE